MGFLDNLDLMTPAERNAGLRGKPIEKGVTRLEDKAAAAADDRRRLDKWRRLVIARDKFKDRYTGQKVIKTMALDPHRAECHHVEPRENYDVRYDVRNGILLSLATHQLVEQNKLRIIGTKFFVVNGRKFIDCSAKVKFEVVK